MATPAPGTIVGVPFVASHGKKFNQDGGSDNWQSENAVDIWLNPGTPITAMAAGAISPEGWGYGDTGMGGRFAGLRLHLVMHGAPNVAFYTHMRALAVPKGAIVREGDLIGYSGIANREPHLHFAVLLGFDPREYASKTYRLSGTKSGTTQDGKKSHHAAQPAWVGLHPPKSDGAHKPLLGAWRDLLSAFSHDIPFAVDHTTKIAKGLTKVLK